MQLMTNGTTARPIPHLVLVLGVMLLLAGFVSAALAHAGKTEKIIIGVGLGPPYVWPFTAVDGGITKKQDINAEYKIFPSGVEAIIATGAGDVHVANGSCSTVVRARANGSRLLVVARNIVNLHEHKLVALGDIRRPEDLKGKRVAMLDGSSTDWYATKYLKAFNLKAGDSGDAVRLTSIAAPEWVPALERKDVVAFFGFEPHVSRALQIVKGSHVLNDGGDNNLFTLMNCLVFNEDWVKNDPDSAAAAMRAIIVAHDVVEADRPSAAERAAPKMRVQKQALLDQMKCCTYRVDFTEDFKEHATEAAQWAESKGMLKKGESQALLGALLYPDLLRRVDPARVTVR
jgi:ABC-type nitrate/sulfonate/bicarbonate transport system substrate-binding protein